MQSGILSAVALGAVALPGSFPHYLAMVQDLHFGMALLTLTKFALAYPVMFHFWNGFRHLAWDMGKGFQIGELYKSGYLVCCLALASTILLCAL